ncbi:GAT1 [[Candida] subhashii]|uniref:GAT1 n=1 Tax=[Candida] subhashii TaxID=561895 RepID=A0A8J5QRU2_9ASCO|nr:GAT1 [[Candida] subhashii]KAG7664132.1 GAT1 [[Candida] subhashii]
MALSNFAPMDNNSFSPSYLFSPDSTTTSTLHKVKFSLSSPESLTSSSNSNSRIKLSQLLEDESETIESIWKMYNNAKQALPNQKRMENLSWRMMYLSTSDNSINDDSDSTIITSKSLPTRHSSTSDPTNDDFDYVAHLAKIGEDHHRQAHSKKRPSTISPILPSSQPQIQRQPATATATGSGGLSQLSKQLNQFNKFTHPSQSLENMIPQHHQNRYNNNSQQQQHQPHKPTPQQPKPIPQTFRREQHQQEHVPFSAPASYIPSKSFEFSLNPFALEAPHDNSRRDHEPSSFNSNVSSYDTKAVFDDFIDGPSTVASSTSTTATVQSHFQFDSYSKPIRATPAATPNTLLRDESSMLSLPDYRLLNQQFVNQPTTTSSSLFASQSMNRVDSSFISSSPGLVLTPMLPSQSDLHLSQSYDMNSKKKKSTRPKIKRADSGSLHVSCTNCHTRTTPLWRRDPNGHPLCNACGLFLKLHGVVRPLSLKTDVIKKRQRSANGNANGTGIGATPTSTTTLSSSIGSNKEEIAKSSISKPKASKIKRNKSSIRLSYETHEENINEHILKSQSSFDPPSSSSNNNSEYFINSPTLSRYSDNGSNNVLSIREEYNHGVNSPETGYHLDWLSMNM